MSMSVENVSKTNTTVTSAEKKASAEKAATEGVKLIDLGLSVRWASANVGARSEKEAGTYYAWGELMTKDDFTKKNYKPEKKYKPLIINDLKKCRFFAFFPPQSRSFQTRARF